MSGAASELEALLTSGQGRTVLDAILETTPSIAVIVDVMGKVLRSSGRASHGIGLMQLLARQLGGEVDFSDRSEGGSRVVATFAVEAAPPVP